MPFRIAILLCISFILLFILSVIAANRTWHDFQDSLPDWTKTKCTLVDEEPTSVGRCVSGNSFYYALVFISQVDHVDGTVNDFNPIESDGRIVASETSQRCIYRTEEDAEEFAKDFEPGERVDCYTNGLLVRLTPGGYAGSEQTMRRLRAIFAIIASIVAGLAVIYAVHHFRVVTNFSTHPPVQQAPDVSRVTRAARAPQAYRRPLSVADTRMLVSSFPEGHDDGTCPICLEEFCDDSRKARTLPCSHVYHEECALQWFRKGHASCPYCNHDLGDEVQRLREEEDNEAREQGRGESSGSSGTLDRSYWPVQWNRSGRREYNESGS